MIDLYDDALRPGQHIRQVGAGQTKIKVAMLIHGGDLEHYHIYGIQVFPVEPGQLGVAHGAEITHSLGDDFPVDSAAVPGVPGEVLPGVLSLGDLGHPHGDAAPDLDIG